MIDLGRIPQTPPLKTEDVCSIARPKGLRTLLLFLGDGELGAALLGNGAAEVVGLDACAGNPARVRVTAVYAIDPDGLPDLPYPPGYFELIVVQDFTRLLRPEKTLGHLRRYLCDGGRFICVLPNLFHEALVASLLGGRAPGATLSRPVSIGSALGALRTAGFELEDDAIAVRTEPGAAASGLCELAVALGRKPAAAQDQFTLVRSIVAARPLKPACAPPPAFLDPWRGSRRVKVLLTPDLERASDPWAASLRQIACGADGKESVTLAVTLPKERLSSVPRELSKAVEGLDVDLLVIEEPPDAAGWERLLAGAGTWIPTSERPLLRALAEKVGLWRNATPEKSPPPAGPLSPPPSAVREGKLGSSPRVAPVRGSSGPQFTVMVPSYNQANFLPATLDSLLAQTFEDWEAVVVNDGSTDSTAAVLDEYTKRDARIRPFHQANGGVGSALNRALQESRGEWICWCSSDDLFLPEKLALQARMIREDPGTLFWHTNYELLQEGKGIRPSTVDPKLANPPVELQVLRFLMGNYVNGISIALNAGVLKGIGGFNSLLSHGQDYDAWLRASAVVRSRFIDQPTCITRLHPGQGTAQFFEAGLFDSALAGASFVQERGFSALFPVLDLNRPDHALHAVVSALQVLLTPGSFLGYSGLAPVLLDQTKAFVALASSPVRERITTALRTAKTNDPQSASTVEQVATAALEFRYRPHDLADLLERRARALRAAGASREFAAFRRYQRMLAERSKRGSERRAS